MAGQYKYFRPLAQTKSHLAALLQVLDGLELSEEELEDLISIEVKLGELAKKHNPGWFVPSE